MQSSPPQHLRKSSHLSTTSDENDSILDNQLQAPAGESPGRMYFNRETQRWEGGEEVDMSGFEDSDGDDKDHDQGAGAQRSPPKGTSVTEIARKSQAWSSPGDRETLGSIDKGSPFLLKGAGGDMPPSLPSSNFFSKSAVQSVEHSGVHFNPISQRWEGTQDIDLSGFDSDSEQPYEFSPLSGGRRRRCSPTGSETALPFAYATRSPPRGSKRRDQMPDDSWAADLDGSQGSSSFIKPIPMAPQPSFGGSLLPDPFSGGSRPRRGSVPRRGSLTSQDVAMSNNAEGRGVPSAVGGASARPNNRLAWMMRSDRRTGSRDSITSGDFDFDEDPMQQQHHGNTAHQQQPRMIEEVLSSGGSTSFDGSDRGDDDDDEDEETTRLHAPGMAGGGSPTFGGPAAGPAVLINIKPIGLTATRARAALLRQSSGLGGGDAASGTSRMYYNAEEQRWEGEQVDLTGFEDSDGEDDLKKKSEGGGTSSGQLLSSVAVNVASLDPTNVSSAAAITTTRIVAVTELDKEKARAIAKELADAFDDFDDDANATTNSKRAGSLLPGGTPPPISSPPPQAPSLQSTATSTAAVGGIAVTSIRPPSPDTDVRPPRSTTISSIKHSKAKTLGGSSSSHRGGDRCLMTSKDRLGSGWYTLGGRREQPNGDKKAKKAGGATAGTNPTATTSRRSSAAGGTLHVRMMTTDARDHSAPPRQRVSAADDFMLSPSVRQSFLVCEEEHQEDMRAFLGNRLYAKAYKIGIQRFSTGGDGGSANATTVAAAERKRHMSSGSVGASTSGSVGRLAHTGGGEAATTTKQQQGSRAKAGAEDAAGLCVAGSRVPPSLSSSSGGRLSRAPSGGGGITAGDRSAGSKRTLPPSTSSGSQISASKSSRVIRKPSREEPSSRRPTPETTSSGGGGPSSSGRLDSSTGRKAAVAGRSQQAAVGGSSGGDDAPSILGLSNSGRAMLRKRLFSGTPDASASLNQSSHRPSPPPTTTTQQDVCASRERSLMHSWQKPGPVLVTTTTAPELHRPHRQGGEAPSPHHDLNANPHHAEEEEAAQMTPQLARMTHMAGEKGWHLAACLTEAQVSRMMLLRLGESSSNPASSLEDRAPSTVVAPHVDSSGNPSRK